MKKILGEFKEFAVKGSVIDLAIGIIIGAAFNKIINSLVNDIILPPIGKLLKGVDFSNLFITLGNGHYTTLKEAAEAGVATINYGLFINALISFLLTALAVFFIVKLINRLKRDEKKKEDAPPGRHCHFCDSAISLKATRCPHCTSTLV
jgi:large conductance mechanosensitive channel